LHNLRVDSLLDFGCGTGSWLRAAASLGLADLVGLDAVELSADLLVCDKSFIKLVDLDSIIDFGRRFDVVLSLEVAEHLPQESAHNLIRTITSHADLCLFSVAIPFQNGQYHINCQWPSYWQAIFNKHGFMCSDDIRPIMWDMDVDPWYKQNIFRAHRSSCAGTEGRILSLVHRDMLNHISLARNSPMKRLFDKARSFLG